MRIFPKTCQNCDSGDCKKTSTNIVPQPSPFRAASFLIRTATDALNIHNALGETSIIYERFKFSNCNKKPDEPIDAYAAAIHGMADTRKVSGLTNELSREKNRMWDLKH